MPHRLTCPYCEGVGCEECDGTGRRYRVGFETDDGVQISVSGSGEFNPALKDAFLALAKAADQHMRDVTCVCAETSTRNCPEHGNG